MDMLSPRPAEPQPDFERERDKVIAAAAARLHQAQRPPRPRVSGAEPRDADPQAAQQQETELARRVAELEERLAAAESALAVAVEARQRAEESLANTQLEHLKALDRMRTLEASERPSAVAEAPPATRSLRPEMEPETEPEPEPEVTPIVGDPSPWTARPPIPEEPAWRPAAASLWTEPVAASETAGPVGGGSEDPEPGRAGNDGPDGPAPPDEGSLRSRLIAAANARRGNA